jgi:hypothetical protein
MRNYGDGWAMNLTNKMMSIGLTGNVKMEAHAGEKFACSDWSFIWLRGM